MHILYVHTIVCELKEIYMYKEELIMKKRLESLKKDQKGFTLVELIVVLVILAILAALLVPALLGYIDRARNSKYLEEARSIYTAVQAVSDERYAKSGNQVNLSDKADCEAIDKLVTPTTLLEGTGTSATALNSASNPVSYKGTSGHKKYTVDKLTKMIFKSQDGKKVTISMDSDGSWDTDNMTVE